MHIAPISLDNVPDLTKPSLAGLAWALRNLDRWPAYFGWDYSHVQQEHSCGTRGCAIGLAAIMWSKEFGPVTNSRMDVLTAADLFRMSRDDAHGIFWDAISYGVPYAVCHIDITPEMVADRIDEHLLRHPTISLGAWW